jgi:hypothetical protein
MPLRAIFRRAVARGEDPTAALELPAMEGTRDRITSPAEAAELFAAWHRAGLEPIGLHECRHTST